MNKVTLPLLLVFGCCLQAHADNWGHWRGPNGNSVSPTASPPTEFSNTENVKWKVAIPGRGSGSPVVWGNQVFVVTAVRSDGKPEAAASEGRSGGRSGGRPGGRGRGQQSGGSSLTQLQFKILSFDRATGKQLWEQTATEAKPHEGTHSTNGFASASPCTDGNHVYAHFGSRGLYCYTMDGQLKWKRDDFAPMQTRNSFGEGSSPVIEGNMVLVPHDHDGESFLYALDKTTGKTIWKTARDEPTCWATPLVVQHNGAKQVVMNGQSYARGYDLTTGKELWRCGGQTERPVATAVADGGLVFVGSGFRGNFMGAFKLSGKGDIEDTDSVAWTAERDCPDIASPLLSGGRLYYYKGKTGLLSCVDAATGKPYYTTQRIDQLNSTYASPVAAGGKIYLSGRSGTIAVIEDSSEFKVLATNSMGETVDATPAPVGDQLFIRGQQHLFCISEN